MKTILTAGLAVAIAGTLLGAPGMASAQQGDMARGAEVYGATCGRCHNPRSPVERSDRDWIVIVNHMRIRAGLTGQQVRDILAFLQATNHVEEALIEGAGLSLMAPSPAAPPAGANVEVSTDPVVVAQGKALISEKGCIGCHVVGGGGGQIGPKLNGVVTSKGALYVHSKLTNPAFNNAGTLMPNLNLTAEQIEALIAYLATLRSEQQ